MKDQDVKDRLAQYTKQALDEGVSIFVLVSGVKYLSGRSRAYDWEEAM